jgi:hypothetical protein
VEPILFPLWRPVGAGGAPRPRPSVYWEVGIEFVNIIQVNIVLHRVKAGT